MAGRRCANRRGQRISDSCLGLAVHLYCPKGSRPPCHPLVLFKAIFLQFICDLSDREIEEQANSHLAWTWFTGLRLEEASQTTAS